MLPKNKNASVYLLFPKVDEKVFDTHKEIFLTKAFEECYHFPKAKRIRRKFNVQELLLYARPRICCWVLRNSSFCVVNGRTAHTYIYPGLTCSIG